MTRRAFDHVAIAIGLLTIACGGAGGAEQGAVKPPSASAGLEIPAAAEPGGVATAEPTPPSEPAQPFEQMPGEQPSGGTESSAGASNGVEISDPEISAFADVIVRLAMLEQQGIERVQAGEAPAQVAAALQPQVEQVFFGTNLDPERFNEIAKLAEEDGALRERIEVSLGERLEEFAQAQEELPA